MNKLNLKKLREVGEKSTEGHWEASNDGTAFIAHQCSEDGDFDFQLLKGWDRKEDCEFSCVARNNWEAILDALEEAKELIKKAERVCDEELLEEIKFHGYFPSGVVNPFSKWLEGFED